MSGATSLGNEATAPSSNGDAERQPLLGRKPDAQPRWRKTLTADVRRKRADVVLLMCYIITGLLDSASISTWGAFVSMQTGQFQCITVIADVSLTLDTRKHCIPRIGADGRHKPMEEIRHLHIILLSRLIPLQPPSQKLLALA